MFKTVFVDTYKEKGLRDRLVKEIRSTGFDNEPVLEAIKEVPRHYFFPQGLSEIAYQNKPYSIGNDQTISQPLTVAIQSALLDIKPYEKVLEIGTGSGYQAVILAKLKARVFTIERIRELYRNAISHPYLKTFYNLKIFYGDGYEGLPKFAPFDKILITAASDELPMTLFHQLKIGGFMVFPKNISNGTKQEMIRLIKISNEEYEIKKNGEFIFVPMVKGKL